MIKNKLKNTLKKLGITEKDTILMHSDITPLVKYTGINWNAASLLLKESILELIGKDGTLIVPTFNFDFIHKKKYIHEKTPSNCGFFSNYILFQTESIRSFHPLHSFCAIGKNAKNLMTNISKSSTGSNSVFDKLYKINAKILLFNCDNSGATFAHYVEQKKKVNYRYLKKIRGIVSKNNKQYYQVFDMYVRDLNLNVKFYPNRLHKYMKFHKRMTHSNILKKTLPISLTNCKKMHNSIFEVLNIKPYFLLKRNPFFDSINKF